MKAPAFDYAKPASLPAVFALMAEHGDEARLLAGGQTLMATLNMRLSEPALLIDLNAVTDLKGIGVQNNVLRIGALATHTEIEASALVADHAPLLAMAAPHIAHRAIRNLGTFGGSIAYADPSAEWPACLMALDGVVLVRSAGAERRIAAKDFFLDLYTTALKPDELIVACEIPIKQPSDAFAFDELARRHGDYAIVGLAVAAERVPGGLSKLRLAYLGMGTTPLRARHTESRFAHQVLTAARMDEAIASLQAELDPLADLTNSAATKRHLAGVLARRLLGTLLENTP
jgi:carbon-monoxide dehydrogenase medium subunit